MRSVLSRVVLLSLLAFAYSAEANFKTEYSVRLSSEFVENFFDTKLEACEDAWVQTNAAAVGSLQDDLYGGRRITRTTWYLCPTEECGQNYCQITNYIVNVNDPNQTEYQGDIGHKVFSAREGCECGSKRNPEGVCEVQQEDAWAFYGVDAMYSSQGDAIPLCAEEVEAMHVCGGGGAGSGGALGSGGQGAALAGAAATAGNSASAAAFSSADATSPIKGQAGNPISCATGVKTQREVIYQGSGAHPLSAKVYYRSHDYNNIPGGYWRHSHEIQFYTLDALKAKAIELPSGSKLIFPNNGELTLHSASRDLGTLTAASVADAEANNWTFLYRQSRYQFINGQLVSKTNRKGYVTSYTYNTSGELTQINNHFGQSIQYDYTAGQLSALHTPDGQTVHLTYAANGLIESIIYPDTTPETFGDNPRKTFVYGEDIIESEDTGTNQHYIIATADNQIEMYLNGVSLGGGNRTRWNRADILNLPLVEGENIIAIKAVDVGGIANMIAELNINGERIGTDSNWKVTTSLEDGWNTLGFDDSAWAPATEYGAYGLYPWNHRVRYMPTDTPGQWIWSPDNDGDDEVYFRRIVTLTSPEPEIILTTRLEGIIDENNQRFATWTYNEAGQAISSEHGDGLEKVELSYADDGTTTDIVQWVNANAARTTSATVEPIAGAPRITELTTTACDNCAATVESRSYNSLGQLTEKVDADGVKTRYIMDENDFVGEIIVAADTNDAQSITLTWNTQLELPLEVVTDKLITTYAYNTSGQVTSIEQYDQLSGETRVTTYSYNALNLLASIDGPRDNVNDITTYSYNAVGLLTQITNALGHTVDVLAYTADGKITSLRDANGLTTTLSYDARGNITAVNQGGRTTQYTYDAAQLLTQVTLPDGQTLAYEYDAGQRLIAVENAAGHRLEYTLDLAGNVVNTTIIDPLNTLTYTQQNVFNGINQLQQSLGNNGQVTSIEYDAFRNPVATTDALGHSTARTFDSLNRLSEIIDPLAGVTRLAYDEGGNLTSVTDAENRSTEYTYNGFGEVTTLVSPDTGTTEYRYDAAGNVLSTTDARGITVNYGYDALNRLTLIDYPNDSDVSFSYDTGSYGLGRLASMTDGHSETHYSYTLWGEIAAVETLIEGQRYSQTMSYDAAGLVQSITLPSGKVLDYSYNLLGQVAGINLDGSAIASAIDYLPFGPMASLSLGNGVDLSNTYDLDYRLIERSDTLAQQNQYQYSTRNNILSIVDGINGNDSTYTYDALARLTTALNDQEDTSFTYNGIGDRAQSRYVGGGLDYWDFGLGHHQYRNYDLTVLDNVDLNGSSDGIDYVAFDGSTASAIITHDEDTYDLEAVSASAWINTTQAGNSYRGIIVKQFAYALFLYNNQLISYDWVKGPIYTGITVNDGEWHHVAMTREAGETATLKIYLDGALVLETQHSIALQDQTLSIGAGNGAGDMQNFTGAIAQVVINDRTISSDEIAARYDSGVGQMVSYIGESELKDTHGNLLEKDGISFRYNDAGRLESATSNSESTSYYYNANQQRVKKVGNVTTHYVYDLSGNLILEADSDGTPLLEYLYLNGQRLAVIKNNALYYTHTNHLDAPIALSDTSGNTVWQASYDAFGKINVTLDQVGGFNARLPGQYEDNETGLYYNWNRYYDPSAGRYITSDPLGMVDGPNTYAYVTNNPINLIDPDGLQVQILCRPADIVFGLIDHCWVKTDEKEAGLGGNPNIAPGEEYEMWGFTDTFINDHSTDVAEEVIDIENVDEDCVNEKLEIGKPLGKFTPPFNHCQSFAWGVINSCRTGPQIPGVPKE